MNTKALRKIIVGFSLFDKEIQRIEFASEDEDIYWNFLDSTSLKNIDNY